MLQVKRHFATAFAQFVRALWFRVRTPDFATAFLATLCGVLVAFVLHDCWNQHQLNRATRQHLHLVYLESQYNITIAQRALNAFLRSTAQTVVIDRSAHSAATRAIHDGNVFSLLPPVKLTLLRSYVGALDGLNDSLDLFRDYLFNSSVRPLPAGDRLVQTVRSSAAAAVAVCIVVQLEFEEYFDKRMYDKKRIQKIETQVEDLKQKALLGKTGVSKDIE